MKKIICLLFFVLLMLIMCFGCSPTVDLPPEETTPPHNLVDESAAKNIAIEYFANIQASGICKDYVFQVIRSDSKENAWIVIFYPEDPTIPGSDYCVVVDTSTGAVIDAYPWG